MPTVARPAPLAATFAATFAALGDPTRLEIVRRLGHGPATVSDLASPFSMSLPGFLKHVRVLEAAGVVRTSKSGRTRRCELDRARLDEVGAWVDRMRATWERRLDRITTYSEEQR